MYSEHKDSDTTIKKNGGVPEKNEECNEFKGCYFSNGKKISADEYMRMEILERARIAVKYGVRIAVTKLDVVSPQP